MTAALEGGEWSAACPGRNLPPGKTRYPFYRRLGGPQCRSGRVENLVPTGIRSRTVQAVVSSYTDWATGKSLWCTSTNYEDHHYVILHHFMFVSDNFTWGKIHESLWRVSTRNLIRVWEVGCLSVAVVLCTALQETKPSAWQLVKSCVLLIQSTATEKLHTVSTSQVDTM